MIISKKPLSFLPFFYSAIGLLLLACDNDNSLNMEMSRTQSTVHRVEIIVAEKKNVSLKQLVSGTLEAVTKIRLYNEEKGRITQLPYYEGDQVKKGSLLVQLDNELLKIDLAEARASKQQAKLDLYRVKSLLPKKISTEDEVARAATLFDLATAEEKRQRTRVQRSSIYAPIDGLITRRLYEPGDMLAQQSHILTIIDPTALKLEVSLAERWLPLVKPDQLVTVHIDALGNRKIAARVLRIHPTVNARTHNGIIEILIDPVPEGAVVGQFARANIELKANERLVIPVHSIHYEPEGAYVFRVLQDEVSGSDASDDNNKSYRVEKVYLEQGQQFNDMAEILSGLNAGDLIVSRGTIGLRDGKKVELANLSEIQNEIPLDAMPAKMPASRSKTQSDSRP
jgi:RND family efflux transporter MFP subunit